MTRCSQKTTLGATTDYRPPRKLIGLATTSKVSVKASEISLGDNTNIPGPFRR